MIAKNNPLSSLRRFFGAAIEQLRVFLVFMNEITLESLRAFWGRRECYPLQRWSEEVQTDNG